MKRSMLAMFGMCGLMLTGCDQGSASKPNPPGTGASGKPQTVVKDGAKDMPEEVKNAKPGSGLGAGGGDGQGRARNPELAGKAGHDRGSKKKAEPSKSDAKDAPKTDGKEAAKSESPKGETKDAPKAEAPKDAGKGGEAKKN